VLDHLFPEGGGGIVFDDPFTDMDAERTVQSCRLLQACAEKHQVIAMTTSLLGLPKPPKPDDAADALAIAICHGNTGESGLARFYNLK
jgi:Holliday junction resolvasome RuvABC endonuclease subunit